MNRILMTFFAALLLIVCTFSAFAQTNTEIEKDLVAALKDVQKYSAYGSAPDDDRLSKANEVFEEKLLKYTKIPATLGYKFAALDKLMFNATSEDGKLRIYSWDTEDGGTMHNFSRVYQFQGTGGNVYSKPDEPTEEGAVGSFVTDIFTLDAKEGKVYIVCATFIGSTNDNGQSANLYRIDGEKLDDQVKLIKTKAGLTNTLGFEYNFFSVVDRKERPVRLISFDKTTRTLKIPVVIEDQKFPNGRVTNKFISYQFDGTNFVKVN